MIKESPLRACLKCYEYIHIAIGVKISAQGRADNCKLEDVPAFTELGDLIARNRKSFGRHTALPIKDYSMANMVPHSVPTAELRASRPEPSS